MPKDYFIRPSVEAVKVLEGNMQEVHDFTGGFNMVVWQKAKVGDYVLKLNPTYDSKKPRFVIVSKDVFEVVYQEGK